MNINLKKLHKDTLEAINKGKEFAALKEAEKAALIAAKQAENVAKAEKILLSIPRLCQEAAMKGKNSVIIYEEHDYNCHKNTFSNHKWHGSITDGPGCIVINAIQQSKEMGLIGLNVSVIAEDDGVGMKSWASIVVSW